MRGDNATNIISLGHYNGLFRRKMPEKQVKSTIGFLSTGRIRAISPLLKRKMEKMG